MTDSETGKALLYMEGRISSLETRVERQSALIEAMMKHFADFDQTQYAKDVLREIGMNAEEIYEGRTWHANANPKGVRSRLGLGEDYQDTQST